MNLSKIIFLWIRPDTIPEFNTTERILYKNVNTTNILINILYVTICILFKKEIEMKRKQKVI